MLSFLYSPTVTSIHDYWKTFVDKVMSLLFSMLSRLVITLLPRSKRLLISQLQSPPAVISMYNLQLASSPHGHTQDPSGPDSPTDVAPPGF